MSTINKKELHEIFQQIADGNIGEYEKLYKKYKKIVYGVTYTILKNKEDSEDVTAQIFTKIYNLKFEQFPKENEASWLYSISKNEAINYLKKKKIEVDIEEIYEITKEDKNIDSIIDMDKYNKMISGLSKKEQEIISLKVLSDFSFREIAQILNMNISTVQWYYYKSIKSLKFLLSNMAMLIISFVLYVKASLENGQHSEIVIGENTTNKNNITENKSGDYGADDQNRNDEYNKIETVNETKDTTTNITEHEATEQNLTLDDNQANSENTNQQNVIEIEQNNINENTSNNNLAQTNEVQIAEISSNKENALFGVTSIFLIVTIIFLIIFIKNQQKPKIKLSK